ncbi:MAG: hypothetical protein ACP5O6_09145 [Candidatus Baltobacteraceae bacterium]
MPAKGAIHAESGTLPAATAERLFDALPVTQIEHCVRASTITDLDYAVLGMLDSPGHWTTCSQSASRAVPAQAGESAILGYILSEGYAAYRSALQGRYDAIGRALRTGGLTQVHLDMYGCYGNCPAYKLDIYRNDFARIRMQRIYCRPLIATATVPFNRVVRALAESDAPLLQPSYPTVSEDTPGASLTLRTKHASFTTAGPDVTGWDSIFSTTVARLDQIVLDTSWTPALPPRPMFAFYRSRAEARKAQHCGSSFSIPR